MSGKYIARLVFTLLVLFLSALSSLRCVAQTVRKNADSESGSAKAKEVCAYIAKEMKAAIPQVPTMCFAKSDEPFLQMSIVVPSDVFEGAHRRAWSIAFFATLQDIYLQGALNGVCKDRGHSTSTCVFDVSDSSLSESAHMHYKILNPSVLGDNDPIMSGPNSDEWYKRWWMWMIEEFDYSGHASNAEMMGTQACKAYLNILSNDAAMAKNPQWMPMPTCSVLLATDDVAYEVIDIPNFWSTGFDNYRLPLRVFCEAFSRSPYKGGVIFRTPWWTDDKHIDHRSQATFGLDKLKFYADEVRSGSRSRFPFLVPDDIGQVEKARPTDSSTGTIYKISTGSGATTEIDFTTGSRWSVPSDWVNKCSLKVGSQIIVDTQGGFYSLSSSCDGLNGATWIGYW